MRPILSTSQVRMADAHTIESRGIRSIELMEHAAQACVQRLLQLEVRPTDPYHVVCGPGNNGGDGLAIARLLHVEGRLVNAVLLDDISSRRSADNQAQLERMREAGVPNVPVRSAEDLPTFSKGIIIDALLGNGTDRPLKGLIAEVVQRMNEADALRIAIDLPSGMNGDRLVASRELVVHAHRTLVLHSLRPCLFHRENAPFLGRWEVLPIGLDDCFISTLQVDRWLMDTADMRTMLPAHHRFMHKGERGHALLIAGSRDLAGAAVLAARAASRAGAGLTSLACVAPVAAAVNAGVPEVMTLAEEGSDRLSRLPEIGRGTAIGIGPGIGTAPATASVLKLLIQQARVPLVIDADGLNILAENPTWLGFLAKGTILTPHPKEFDRLAGASSDSMERLLKAREFAVRNGVVLVLKGAYTVVCTPAGRIHFNPTGNEGLAKGGSGDVLTGCITALLAQGLGSVQAALLGVFVHGMAGDLTAEHIGMDAMTASDVIDHIAPAMRSLRERGQSSPSSGPRP